MKADPESESRRDRPDQAGAIHRRESFARHGDQLFAGWLPQLRGNRIDKIVDGMGLSVGYQRPENPRRRGEQAICDTGLRGKIVCVVSGGNIDLKTLLELLSAW